MRMCIPSRVLHVRGLDGQHIERQHVQALAQSLDGLKREMRERLDDLRVREEALARQVLHN